MDATTFIKNTDKFAAHNAAGTLQDATDAELSEMLRAFCGRQAENTSTELRNVICALTIQNIQNTRALSRTNTRAERLQWTVIALAVTAIITSFI